MTISNYYTYLLTTARVKTRPKLYCIEFTIETLEEIVFKKGCPCNLKFQIFSCKWRALIMCIK